MCAGRVMCRNDTGGITASRLHDDHGVDGRLPGARSSESLRVTSAPRGLTRQCNMKADIAWYLAEMPDEPWGYGFDAAVGDGEV